MHFLSTIDYTIIVTYFLATIIVGLIMARKASTNLEHYFLGGRSLPWYLLGVAGMASWFDMTGTMIITSFLYMLGPRGLYIEFRGGAVLVLIFLIAYTGKWHRRSGCMTAAEWFTYRFGTGISAEAVRFMTAATGIITTIGMLAYLVRGSSLFLSFFPYPPMVTTGIVVGLATVYMMCAGFYGVVFTDLLQGIIVLASCVVISVMAFMSIGGTAEIAEVARQVTGNTAWTHSAPAWHTTMPAGYEAYQSLIIFAMFYLLRNLLWGMGTGNENRYFGARNDRECGLQSMLQGITVMPRWPMMMGFAVMGLILVRSLYPDMEVVGKTSEMIRNRFPEIQQAYWHDLTSNIIREPGKYPAEAVEEITSLLGPDWKTKLPLVGYNGTVNPEQILPAVIMHRIPTGLRGLLIVAMLAALMSTLTGTVNSTTALFVRDIYQNFLRPRAGDRELIRVSYLATLALVVSGFVMGVAAKSINDLWGWIIMGLGGGMLAPMILRLYWWRCNAWGIAGGMLLGGVGAVVQRLVCPEMIEWKQFLLMSAFSFGGTIFGSLLTAPIATDTIRHFYRTTRPFGLWGPYWKELTREERVRWGHEHRVDIMTLPFALLWQVTFFLLPMQLVIKSYHSFFITLPLFLVGCAGLYWYWWRNLPAGDSVEGSARGFDSAANAKK